MPGKYNTLPGPHLGRWRDPGRAASLAGREISKKMRMEMKVGMLFCFQILVVGCNIFTLINKQGNLLVFNKDEVLFHGL